MGVKIAKVLRLFHVCNPMEPFISGVALYHDDARTWILTKSTRCDGCGVEYAGTVKRHNVCKRHVSIDTSFKQTERTIPPPRYFNGIKIVTAFKCIFGEKKTVQKLSVYFGNRISQEPISRPCLEFRFYGTTIQRQMLIKFAAEVSYLYW